MYTRALNIPENDDLQDVLFFLLELTDADSITATLGAFFAQHADHMTAASRILYWALWKCEGQINFHHLALIAPLGILLWTWLLYLQFHNNPNRNIAVLLACLCLLNPRAYTLLTWPMAAIEFYFSFFYAFAVFCCLEKQSRGFFLLALVAAALATFSFAPGIFSWPVGLLFLLYSRYQGQAVSYLKIGVWVATATTVLVAFSLLFEPGSGSSATMLRFLIEQPLYALQFYLAIAGSVFSYGNTGVAVGVGALLVAAALILLLRGFSSKLGALHFFMLYCLCALGLLTIGRAHASTVSVFVEPLLLELSLTPRYSFVSMMLLASVLCVYLYSRQQPPVPKVVVSLGVLGVLLLLNFRVYLPQIDAHRQLRLERYQRNGLVPPLFDAERVNSKIEGLVNRGIYQPPDPDNP